MNKGNTCNQPARQNTNRPDLLDVTNALQACQQDFGGIARLQFLVKSIDPDVTDLRIDASWSAHFDNELNKADVTVQWHYEALRDGDIAAAALSVVSRLYDRLTERMKADVPNRTLARMETIINRYWLA